MMWPIFAADPCIPPSLPEWRLLFPEFSGISADTVLIAIADASCWADSTWASETWCMNCTQAIAFLAAHFLALQLFGAANLPSIIPADEGSGEAQIIAGGDVSSIRFESMSVSFTAPKAVGGGGGGSSSGGGVGSAYDLSSTPYGQMYLTLLKVNQPAIAIV